MFKNEQSIFMIFGTIQQQRMLKVLSILFDDNSPPTCKQGIINYTTIVSCISCSNTSVTTQTVVAVPMYLCTDVQMYRCTDVPMYRCTDVPMYQFADVPMYRCTYVLVYWCTYVPIYRCTDVPMNLQPIAVTVISTYCFTLDYRLLTIIIN